MRLGKYIIVILLLFIAPCSLYGQVYVHGYYKKDGTYVQPYYRSNPDGNPYNNWSTKGKTNPYTGAPGTKNPQQQPPTTTHSSSPPTTYTPSYPAYTPVTSAYDYTPLSYSTYTTTHVSKWRQLRHSGYMGWTIGIGILGATIIASGHKH